ncbi:PfkB family carbohydrate kinase [Tropicimonas isoalkanivorans]|uniref:Sugar or nucleoside kinase, ribokinase family n=1 Tax=Tropicimonas isoalkanivorans TaxID=441112 RepID=A0A1I1DE75_9RHOB|nr:PfkB family carbohydrate kinase [Tropicimonas isoalkanivorans]SFB71080.1 Sugar or nucleoside kinase, ribokinase family [Tropicimonas isoalkanivorans]
MESRPDILCIGSVLWDVIGRTPRSMAVGHDVPGRITRVPGGVAMNIAMALCREGMRPSLLTVLGRDAPGQELASAAKALGMDTAHVTWSEDLPTDQYMAIEAENGLIAAVADAHSLERAGDAILAPLIDGRLGSAERPHSGIVAVDGNLTEDLLSRIADSPLFAQADLRIAPASPGKAGRLLPLLRHPAGTLYVNRIEAGLICDDRFPSARHAAEALVARGARRALVTDGAAPMAEASAAGVLTAVPPQVVVTRVTGAGDTFMAAHIAAEARGLTGIFALERALGVTAAYISETE